MPGKQHQGALLIRTLFIKPKIYNGKRVKLFGASNEPICPVPETILYAFKISQTALTKASRASATDECNDRSTAKKYRKAN